MKGGFVIFGWLDYSDTNESDRTFEAPVLHLECNDLQVTIIF